MSHRKDPNQLPVAERSSNSVTDEFRNVLRAEADSILAAADRLGTEIEAAIELLQNVQGRVIFTGLGKSGYIARKSAATFCSTGSPAIFLHPSEALHGDLGVVATNDVLIALSNSGETAEVLELLPHMARMNVPVIAVTGSPHGSLAQRSRIVLNAGVACEADQIALTPTSSTTVALAICDALAVTLMVQRGFTREQFAIFHPGGNLGRKLLTRVGDLMRVGQSVPKIHSSQSLNQAIEVISAKRMGAVFVVDGNEYVVGILTDGDLRRLYQQEKSVDAAISASSTIDAIMTPSPKTIIANALAAEALKLMEDYQITVLPVVDDQQLLLGAIHLHDLIRAGLA